MSNQIFVSNRLKALYRLYDRVLTVEKSKNESRVGIYKKSGFYIDAKGFYSGADNVTYIYTVVLPNEVDESFHTTLRSVCEDNVRINFITELEKHKIVWTSNRMKNKLRNWRQIEQERANEIDDYNLHENVIVLDRGQWRKLSLRYLAYADTRRRRRLFKVRTLILVSGKRGDSFDTTVKNLEDLCKDKLGLRLTRIMYDVPKYLKYFSPFSLTYDKVVTKETGFNIVTDEIASRFSTYSKGTIGKSGIYWGTDIETKYAVIKPVKPNDTDSENWLITGETNSGKSVTMKMLIGQLLMLPNMNGTIMDVEGFEYLHWAYLLAKDEEVVILNLAEGEGRYFDPVEIALTGNKKFDVDNKMFSLSKSYTIGMLKVLVGEAASEDYWVDSIIRKVVTDFYRDLGVTDEYETWSKSKGMSLFDVAESFKKLNVKNEMQKNALDLCIENISVQLENLKERVNIKEIITAKLLICSFGMAGKTESSIDRVNLALMQLCTANISHLRSIFSKLYGKYNFKVWEEFQRWGRFPGSKDTINVALTGGRKLGDINIIATNKLGELLANDELGILETISSFALGGINDEKVRRAICDRFSIPEMKEELDIIDRENRDNLAYIKGDMKVTSEYTYSFLVGLDKSRYTVSKMIIPDWLIKSELFHTGVN